MILFSINLQQTSLLFYFPLYAGPGQQVFKTSSRQNSPHQQWAKPDYNDNDDTKSGQH